MQFAREIVTISIVSDKQYAEMDGVAPLSEETTEPDAQVAGRGYPRPHGHAQPRIHVTQSVDTALEYAALAPSSTAFKPVAEPGSATNGAGDSSAVAASAVAASEAATGAAPTGAATGDSARAVSPRLPYISMKPRESADQQRTQPLTVLDRPDMRPRLPTAEVTVPPFSQAAAQTVAPGLPPSQSESDRIARMWPLYYLLLLLAAGGLGALAGALLLLFL